MDMREQLEQIRAEAEAAMENAASLQELDAVRVKYLGTDDKNRMNLSMRDAK